MRNFYKFTFIILLSIGAKAQVATTSIVSASAVFCTGTAQNFSAVTTQTSPTYSWTIAPARYSTLIGNTQGSVFTFTPSNAGTYTVTLVAANSETTTVAAKIFNVTRSATASFNASLSGQGFPAKLSLTNYSSNSIKNYWIFDNNPAEKDSGATLTRNYTAGGLYNVALVAKGPNNCDDISYYTFRISDSSGVTLPDIFSPNGDGINDVFKPIARGVVTLNAWVYNRYGVIITTWDKVNGFWDGYTTSGEPCSAGDYFVVVEATGFDGQHYKLKGNLTLMR